ncbi:AsmA family protein [Aliivibrio kagoshimensis]|uniref:AsmA family protein n=1 Tax=Aliivibrio kagoshimensis TaxID=2910230 RepID=UPI003D0DF081
MKKLAVILFAIITIVAVALIALVTLVNPNQFKPLIVEQVKKSSSRDLIIEGDIEWRLFPSIGFTIGKIELNNPTGFTHKNLVQFDNAELDISVMPLFSQTLEIGNITLDGASLFIETLKDGRSNLDGLSGDPASESQMETAAEPTPTAPEIESNVTTEQESDKKSWKIVVAGIDIINASATIDDRQLDSFTQLSELNLHLDAFVPGEWSRLQFDVKGKKDKQQFTTSVDTSLFLETTLDSGKVKDLSLNGTFNDQVNQIKMFDLTLDHFALGEWSNIGFSVKGEAPDMAFTADGSTALNVSPDYNVIKTKALDIKANLIGAALPKGKMAIGMNADTVFTADKQFIDVSNVMLKFDQLVFDGALTTKLSDIPQVRVVLHSPNVDLDQLLGDTKKQAPESGKSTESTEPSSKKEPAKETIAEQEPDLSVLKTLDIAGKISIDTFKANNLKMSDLFTDFSVIKGLAELKRFRSNLYNGSIDAKATLNAKGKLASYTVDSKIKGVKISPLLDDLMGDSVVEGTANTTAYLVGKGLAPTTLKKNIKGTVDIVFADGAVKGLNVAQILRVNYAKITGKGSSEKTEPKQTDFSSLTATIKLANGIASTNNLAMQSPMLRIKGAGDANYIEETANVLIQTSVVGSLKGQGGKDINDLKDLTIPVRVFGPWASPEYKVELSDVLEQQSVEKAKKIAEEKTKKELQRGLDKILGDKADDDKVNEAANKLLNKLFH